MSEKIIVSVCMITYGHENYIKQAIEGVLMQEGDFDVELIIADDCSPDNTQAIVQEILSTHPKGYWIKYTKQKKNKGMMPNFIWALEQCQGNYMALCEGDDYWTDPLKLQKQVKFLKENKEYVMCFHPCEVLRQNRGEIKKQSFNGINYEYNIKNLLSFWNIPTASMVFKRDHKIIYPEWFFKVASGDIALSMLYFEKGKFKLLNEYMSVYRLTITGASNSHQGYRMIHYRAILYTYLNEFFEYRYEKDIYDALNHIYINFSGSTDTNMTKKKSVQSILKKIKKNITK